MAPPQAISILSYIFLCLLLMVSWQVPYPAKDCRFTSIMASEVTQIVAPFPRHLFESDSNNGLFPGHLNVRWSYICSCLLPMVSWQVPYLAKGCRPDFNNGFRSDSNSGFILAPSVYSSLTQIMAASQAIPILNCNHELAQSYFKPALDRHKTANRCFMLTQVWCPPNHTGF